MTREGAKEFMWLENNKNPSVIKWQHHKTIRNLVEKLIDQLFNDHEAQLKAKESDLERQDMIIKCLNIDLDNKEKLLKAKDEEIETWKTEFRHMQDIAIKKDVELCKALEYIEELKDNA